MVGRGSEAHLTAVNKLLQSWLAAKKKRDKTTLGRLEGSEMLNSFELFTVTIFATKMRLFKPLLSSSSTARVTLLFPI